MLSYDGQFSTSEGDALDSYCLGVYNSAFNAVTYSMMLELDAQLGTTLCQGHDATMVTSSAYLLASENQVSNRSDVLGVI